MYRDDNLYTSPVCFLFCLVYFGVLMCTIWNEHQLTLRFPILLGPGVYGSWGKRFPHDLDPRVATECNKIFFIVNYLLPTDRNKIRPPPPPPPSYATYPSASSTLGRLFIQFITLNCERWQVWMDRRLKSPILGGGWSYFLASSGPSSVLAVSSQWASFFHTL